MPGVDLSNAFNNKNFSGFDGFFNNQTNPATGQPFDTLGTADLDSATSLLTMPRCSSSFAPVPVLERVRRGGASTGAPALLAHAPDPILDLQERTFRFFSYKTDARTGLARSLADAAICLDRDDRFCADHLLDRRRTLTSVRNRKAANLL